MMENSYNSTWEAIAFGVFGFALGASVFPLIFSGAMVIRAVGGFLRSWGLA